MIDEKKIEEAAINASIEDTDKGRVREDYVIGAMADHELGFQDGFKAGINWFKDNLWHDASEEPEKNKLCLVKIDIIDGFKIASDYTTSSLNDKGWTENYFPDNYDINVSNWLYIEDLMKGEK